MESVDVLENDDREVLPFPIGSLVQRSHGLYGMDIGVVLTFDHQNFADPLEKTHVIVGGVVLFRPTLPTILPDDEHEAWPVHAVQEASEQYAKRYNEVKS